MKLSIIIPVYNEKATLAILLRQVHEATQYYNTEIIVVDDCSSDGSEQIIREQVQQYSNVIGVLRHINRGKGAAIREALRIVTGDLVLIQDADLEYSPSDYPRLLDPILQGKARVVYGSRFVNSTVFGMSPLFRWGNLLLTWWTNVLFRSTLTDMETCYKVIPAEILKAIPLSGNRFDFEPEITAKLLNRGINIVEVPISYNGRNKLEGKKIGVRDGIVAAWALLKYRRNPVAGEAANEMIIIRGSL